MNKKHKEVQGTDPKIPEYEEIENNVYVGKAVKNRCKTEQTSFCQSAKKISRVKRCEDLVKTGENEEVAGSNSKSGCGYNCSNRSMAIECKADCAYGGNFWS